MSEKLIIAETDQTMTIHPRGGNQDVVVVECIVRESQDVAIEKTGSKRNPGIGMPAPKKERPKSVFRHRPVNRFRSCMIMK